MAKTVEVTKVLIHYSADGTTIHARIRSYAGTTAFLEESVELKEADVLAAALARNAPPMWDESDICTALGDAVPRTDHSALAIVASDAALQPDA